MQSRLPGTPSGPAHTQWCLHHDPTVETRKEPWGVEIVSHILLLYTTSKWRADVEALWSFLNGEYIVTANNNCSTHVHISLAKGYSVSDLKNLAASVIYFEPALEALVPPNRRGNEYARSNWIDNANFGYKKKLRSESIAMIMKCGIDEEVINLMNPRGERYFGWNFLALRKYKTIEFRRGAASLSVRDAFMWVELAVSFVLAALRLGSAQELTAIPATVGGLRAFMSQAKLENALGQKNPPHVNRLFQDRVKDERVDPIPVGDLTPEKRLKLKKKIEADAKSDPMLDRLKSAQAS
ncbi:MAG: hypothetical protein Q9157_002542, partial [Trypethelium eluteriae]